MDRTPIAGWAAVVLLLSLAMAMAMTGSGGVADVVPDAAGPLPAPAPGWDLILQ